MNRTHNRLAQLDHVIIVNRIWAEPRVVLSAVQGPRVKGSLKV